MQLSCKSCGKPVPAEDVNIELAIAKCHACNAVFNILDQVGGPGPVPKPAVTMPKRFQVDEWGADMTITRRWYSHAIWVLVFFCVFWDGFLIAWYTGAASIFREGEILPGLVMIAFSVLHLAVGVGLSYLCLATIFNRTVIRVAMGELAVKHGPIPFPGNRRLLTSDIKQLYCTEKVHHGKHGRRNYTYNVMLQLRSDEKVKLISNLTEIDQALFIEQKIEQHLKIADERVAGEVGV